MADQMCHNREPHRAHNLWGGGWCAGSAKSGPTSERQDLRERITETATEWALMYPLANYGFWSCADGKAELSLNQIADTIAKAWGRDIADRVLAVLVEPPGDLREQTAKAIDAVTGGTCPMDIVDAALSVCWEDAARRIAAAEAERNAAEARADRATADLDAAIGDHAEERTALEEENEKLRAKVAGYERAISWDTSCTEHGRLLDAMRTAEEQRDEAQGQVAALQRELAEVKADRDTNFSVLQRVSKGGWESATDLVNERIARKQAESNLTAAKRAVYAAQAVHIRETHPDRMHVADCLACHVLVPLSAAMPSRPDGPEEIRRLAQATTEEKTDEA